MGLFDKKHNDMPTPVAHTNSFTDIMNGLQYAVNSAQEMLQHHQVQSLLNLFSATENPSTANEANAANTVGRKFV